jgi:hypothetical protein
MSMRLCWGQPVQNFGQALIEHALALASLGIVSRPHDPAGCLGSSIRATGHQIDAEE